MIENVSCSDVLLKKDEIEGYLNVREERNNNSKPRGGIMRT